MKKIGECRIGKPHRDRAHVAAVSVGVFLALAACQSATEPRSSLVPGWVRATFLEAPDRDVGSWIEGVADFALGGNPGVGPSFQLTGVGKGASEGEYITFYRLGPDQPAPGRYKLAPLTTRDGHPRGFTAYYSVQGVHGLQAFTALSGSVTIDKSTNEEVDGTFQMTLVQTCKRSNTPSPDDWCAASPNVITPGAKQITVSGSFHATPLSADPVHVGVGHVGDS